MANSARPLTLEFPFAGYNKRPGFARQSPFTSFEARNVWPDDALEMRRRGGSRPGLGKHAYADMGGPVQMLNEVVTVPQDGFAVWQDLFDQTELASHWEQPVWVADIAEVYTPYRGISYNNITGGVRTTLTGLDTSQPYVVEMFISPWGADYGGKFQLTACMNDTTPDAPNDGLIFELDLTGASGAYSATLNSYNAGAETAVYSGSGSLSAVKGGWMRLLIDGTDISGYWGEDTLFTAEAVTLGGSAGTRFGFVLEAVTDGAVCLIDTYRVQYYKTGKAAEDMRSNLIASAAGDIYQSTWLGTMEQQSVTGTLGDERPLDSAEYLQKLYIADWESAEISITGATVAADGITITKGGTDFSTLSANDHVITLSGGTGAVTDGVYAIASSSASNVVLATSCGGSGTASVRGERTVKVYDPTDKSLAILEAATGKGFVQPGCKMVCIYRSRLCIAGPATAPHAFFWSRQGDPTDWDYSQDDEGAAIAGTPFEDGTVGLGLTAQIPFGNDYLIYGCQSSLWLVRGDLTAGGDIDNISQTVGVVAPGAWCLTPSNDMIFLAQDGIYGLPPNKFDPQPISREMIPDELLNVDPDNVNVRMAYDHVRRAVHIYLTQRSDGVSSHYWLDWGGQKGIWPMTVQTDHDPWTVLGQSRYGNGILVGCRDGYIREYRQSLTTDDGYDKDELVTYGPIKIGGRTDEAVLQQIVAALPENSGDIDWEVLVGPTNESLARATAFATGTWSNDDWQNHAYPRARGGSFAIRLKNSDNTHWAIEVIEAHVARGGKKRVR